MQAITVPRIDSGPRLVIEEPLELARDFFTLDASSRGPNSFDARAGKGDPNRIVEADVRAINTTMRARARHSAWEAEYAAVEPLPWLSAIGQDWDLIASGDEVWEANGCTRIAAAAIKASTGKYRGISVSTKVLHLKRPRIFPVLDSLVLEQIGATSHSTEAMLDHLRGVGRANLLTLNHIEAQLAAQGIQRTLVRIMDGLLWASHPDAGLTPKLGRWERVVQLR
jgi:hypothetical protein